MATTIPTVNNGDEITDDWGNLVGERVTYHDATLESILADWVSYTPDWLATTTNPVIGNGVKAGRYKQIGKLVWFRINITLGSTTTVGSGTYTFTPPVGISQELTNADTVGRWRINDVSAPAHYGGDAIAFGNSIYLAINTSPITYVMHNSPFAWAIGDHIDMAGCYRSV